MKKKLMLIIILLVIVFSGCQQEKLFLTNENILVKCPQISQIMNSLYYFNHTTKDPYVAPTWFKPYETDTYYNEKEFLSKLEIDLYLPENILKNLGGEYYQKILYQVDAKTNKRTNQQMGIEIGGFINNRNGLRKWSYQMQTENPSPLFVDPINKLDPIYVNHFVLTIYFEQRNCNYEYGEALNIILFGHFFINDQLYFFNLEYDFLK